MTFLALAFKQTQSEADRNHLRRRFPAALQHSTVSHNSDSSSFLAKKKNQSQVCFFTASTCTRCQKEEFFHEAFDTNPVGRYSEDTRPGAPFQREPTAAHVNMPPVQTLHSFLNHSAFFGRIQPKLWCDENLNRRSLVQLAPCGSADFPTSD